MLYEDLAHLKLSHPKRENITFVSREFAGSPSFGYEFFWPSVKRFGVSAFDSTSYNAITHSSDNKKQPLHQGLIIHVTPRGKEGKAYHAQLLSDLSMYVTLVCRGRSIIELVITSSEVARCLLRICTSSVAHSHISNSYLTQLTEMSLRLRIGPRIVPKTEERPLKRKSSLIEGDPKHRFRNKQWVRPDAHANDSSRWKGSGSNFEEAQTLLDDVAFSMRPYKIPKLEPVEPSLGNASTISLCVVKLISLFFSSLLIVVNQLHRL